MTVAHKNVLSNTNDWINEKYSIIAEEKIKLGLLFVTLSVVLSLGGILADILENFLMLETWKLPQKFGLIAGKSKRQISAQNFFQKANPWQRSHQRPTFCSGSVTSKKLDFSY